MTRPNISLVQKRVANIAIGPSTLRNQGKCTISVAIEFLSSMDLNRFRVKTEKDFARLMNELTKELMSKFPPDARNNWGAARKSINVFLEEVFYNRFLVKQYRLQNLERYLEVPLDGQVTKKLLENNRNLPRWKGIKYLTEENSQKYQDFAKNLAKEKKTSRVYLDLEYWRGKN